MTNDNVALTSAPLIPGLTFRRFRGARDLAGIATLHRERAEHDQLDPLAPGQRPPTAAELASVYRQRLDFDPARQMLLAEIRGRLVGYVWIRSWQAADGSWVLFHRLIVAPVWRGKGISVTLMRWAELSLTEIAAHRPPGTSALLRTDIYSTEIETVARLEAANYHVGHSNVELTLPSLIDLPEPTTPDGFEIRQPRPDEYRSAYFALEAAFADEWNYEEKTEDDFLALMQSPGNDPALWRIAVSQEQVAGVIMCEANPPAGIVSDLSVGVPWRRHGLGRALLLSGLQALRQYSLTEARVYTDAADPFGARTLYESIGFRPVKEVLSYLKRLQST